MSLRGRRSLARRGRWVTVAASPGRRCSNPGRIGHAIPIVWAIRRGRGVQHDPAYEDERGLAMTGRRGVLALLATGAGGLAAGPARAAASDRDALLAELVDERAIRRLFSGYVAAVMRRDGAAVQAFFTADAWIRNFTNVAGEATPGVAPLRASEIGAFVDRAYHPYHPGQWSHIVHA